MITLRLGALYAKNKNKKKKKKIDALVTGNNGGI